MTGPERRVAQGRRGASATGRLAWDRGAVVALALASIALSAPSARAHDTSPGVLGLDELGDGRFLVAWTLPEGSGFEDVAAVHPRFPAHCTRDGAFLDCGERGLTGGIAIDGLDGTPLRVVVAVTRLDAAPIEAVLDADTPSLSLDGAGSGFGAFVALGVEHVLLGLDHLAFLLGLLLVSTIDRRLVLTITAFTVGHSVTLGLAALDLVRPSSALVEALIALSVLLVARDALETGSRSSIRRAPWLVSALFGLVHGLGLAGALRDAALPRAALVPALLGFNVGVELGQLAFVAAALGAAALVRTRSWAPRGRTALAYAIGSAAAYWLVVRTAAMVSG